MTIKNYSTTDTENNGTVPNGAPDGMLPSDVIDVFRQQMADHRVQWNDAQWFEFLDGTPDGIAVYVSSNQFKITGADVSSHYHIGRRVKIVGAGTVYGSITAVSYGAGDTTVTVDTSLTNESISVFTSVLSSENDALPREAVQDIVGAMLSGNTTSAIDVTYQDSDGTIDFAVTSQATDNNFTNAYKTKLDGVATSANNYSHPTTAGNKHVPTGGSSGQFLKYSASGTAVWNTPDFISSNAADSASGVISFTNSTNSTTKDNGAVVITAGGLGVEGNINAGGDITAYASSDFTKKRDIVPIKDPLGKVHALSGNSFYFRAPTTASEHGKQYGIIAQEIETIFPEMIAVGEDGSLRVRQAGFELTALLIEAVKELSIKISKLEERL